MNRSACVWMTVPFPGDAVTRQCFRLTNRDKALSIRSDQHQRPLTWHGSVCRPEAVTAATGKMTGEEDRRGQVPEESNRKTSHLKRMLLFFFLFEKVIRGIQDHQLGKPHKKKSKHSLWAICSGFNKDPNSHLHSAEKCGRCVSSPVSLKVRNPQVFTCFFTTSLGMTLQPCWCHAGPRLSQFVWPWVTGENIWRCVIAAVLLQTCLSCDSPASTSRTSLKWSKWNSDDVK